MISSSQRLLTDGGVQQHSPRSWEDLKSAYEGMLTWAACPLECVSSYSNATICEQCYPNGCSLGKSKVFTPDRGKGSPESQPQRDKWNAFPLDVEGPSWEF